MVLLAIFITLIYHQGLFGTCKTKPRILEQYSVNIWAERHRSIHTEFSFAKTRLNTESPPLRQTATIAEMKGEKECQVSFEIQLCQDVHPKRRICIYKDSLEDRMGGIFDVGTFVLMENLKFSPGDLHKIVTPVSGFMVNEANSIAKGYIINRSFYGSIRFYDKHRLYHVVYYVEPLSSVSLYNKNYPSGFPSASTTVGGKNLGNAIVFEYISHSSDAYWSQCGKPLLPPSGGQRPVTTHQTPSGIPSHTRNASNFTTTQSFGVTAHSARTTSMSGAVVSHGTTAPSTATENITIAYATVSAGQTAISDTGKSGYPSNSSSPESSDGSSKTTTLASRSPVTVTTIITATSLPYHSTEKFGELHSTESPMRTDVDYIHKQLGHSTDATAPSIFPPYHSTDFTGSAATVPDVNTTLTTTAHFSWVHSTAIVFTMLTGIPVHSTESFTGTSTSTPIPFAPSTEITPPSTPEPTTSSSTEKPTTRKILNSAEVLSMLSTERSEQPYHSTERSTGPAETTTMREMTFHPSTEHSPVTDLIIHSTEPSPETTLYGESKATNTPDRSILGHSTQAMYHSTDFTGKIPSDFFPIQTTGNTTPATQLYHSTEVPTVVYHSTDITLLTPTLRTNTRPTLDSWNATKSTTTSERASTAATSIPTTGVYHSTAVSVPKSLLHSSTVNQPTHTKSYTQTPKPPTTTGKAAVLTTSATVTPPSGLQHSTERDRVPFHSTMVTTEEPEPTIHTDAVNATAAASGVVPSTLQITKGKAATTALLGHSTFVPAVPYHSTESPPDYGPPSRKRRALDLNQFFAEYPMEIDEEDIARKFHFIPGSVSTKLFDAKSDETFICQLCIWIQPHFAEIFGLGGGIFHGVAEVIDIIKFANQLFRSMDFNQDGIPENIGFSIKQIWLTDDIAPDSQTTRKRAFRNKRRILENLRTVHNTNTSNLNRYRRFTQRSSLPHRRKKREYEDDGFEEILSRLHKLYEAEEMYGPRKRRDDFEFENYAYYEKYDAGNEIKPGLGPQLHQHQNYKEVLREKLNGFSRVVKVLNSRNALRAVETQLKRKMTECCAILSFLYHDMTPSIAVTSERGLCNTHNVGLISGMFHGHKTMKFDVYRGVMHALGHLFGANHDAEAAVDCEDSQMDEFINPFILHPIQQTNVGARPNSFRFSSCAKDAITMFLSSNGAHCLKETSQGFCGNGVIEDGEICDCGSLWQCHQKYPCCGEADTYLGCKIIADAKARCFRPTLW